MAELSELRQNLKSTIKSYWSSDDAQNFRDDLKSVFGQDARDVYEDCAEEPGQPLTDCLEEAAEDEGIDADFTSEWGNAPDELVHDLRTVGNMWTPDQAETVRDVVMDANIDTLYRLCANGEYGEVQSKLGLDTQPNTYQNCTTEVSDAQNLRDDLRNLWWD